ncbi:hypothetical protein EV361DRAFT_151624 [Lentinula raphanica]|nr:hypothetical protein EV361DRAFT_151624 [Lentinula raphanica]
MPSFFIYRTTRTYSGPGFHADFHASQGRVSHCTKIMKISATFGQLGAGIGWPRLKIPESAGGLDDKIALKKTLNVGGCCSVPGTISYLIPARFMGNDDVRALMPVLLILVCLMSAALLWCFLSSCMGTPIRQVLSARHGGSGRRTFGDEELWEMENRRRT